MQGIQSTYSKLHRQDGTKEKKHCEKKKLEKSRIKMIKEVWNKFFKEGKEKCEEGNSKGEFPCEK